MLDKGVQHGNMPVSGRQAYCKEGTPVRDHTETMNKRKWPWNTDIELSSLISVMYPNHDSPDLASSNLRTRASPRVR